MSTAQMEEVVERSATRAAQLARPSWQSRVRRACMKLRAIRWLRCLLYGHEEATRVRLIGFGDMYEHWVECRHCLRRMERVFGHANRL